MQRKGISEVVNIFRYNSPSKAYVKRLGGMPKYIKERPTEEPPVDYSKLKYLSKEDAPFAVLDDSLKLIYRWVEHTLVITFLYTRVLIFLET